MGTSHEGTFYADLIELFVADNLRSEFPDIFLRVFLLVILDVIMVKQPVLSCSRFGDFFFYIFKTQVIYIDLFYSPIVGKGGHQHQPTLDFKGHFKRSRSQNCQQDLGVEMVEGEFFS